MITTSESILDLVRGAATQAAEPPPPQKESEKRSSASPAFLEIFFGDADFMVIKASSGTHLFQA